MVEANMSMEIQALRDHVEQRFQSLEKWLERVTTAVEKHSENKERLIVLETRHAALEAAVEGLEKRLESKVDALGAKLGEVRDQVLRYGVYVALAIGGLTMAGPYLLKSLLGQ